MVKQSLAMVRYPVISTITIRYLQIPFIRILLDISVSVLSFQQVPPVRLFLFAEFLFLLHLLHKDFLVYFLAELG